MFWALLVACFVVSVRLVRDEMTPILFKQRDPVVRQFKYEYEAKKEELKEEYEKTNLPKSGYMLREDYEKVSKGVPRMDLQIPNAEPIKKSNMKYVPQPTYKLVRYNNPPGTPELNLPRKVNFDRQINAQGIVSGDFTMIVYPTVYYDATHNCTSCFVFVIPLDTKLTKQERVMKANVARKIDKPLFETDKDISVEGAFRTITPVDFSEDNRYIIAKEKLGWVHEGIWKTNLWVHDFHSGRSWELPEVRAAIINYWHNVTGVDMAEQRWDIYPLGFDKTNQERILVCAYAYTGDLPAFLGTWAVDVTGEKCELVDLKGSNYQVSTVGFKLVFDSFESRDLIEFEAKRQEKLEKKYAKKAKKELKAKRKAHKKVYKEKLKMLRRQYKFKLKEYRRSKKKGATSMGGDDQINPNTSELENSPDIDYEKFNQERNELIEKQKQELLEKSKKGAKKVKEKKDKVKTNVKNNVQNSADKVKENIDKTENKVQENINNVNDSVNKVNNAVDEVKQNVEETKNEVNDIKNEVVTPTQDNTVSPPILRE